MWCDHICSSPCPCRRTQIMVLVLVLESEGLVLVLGTQVLVLVLGEKSLLTSLGHTIFTCFTVRWRKSYSRRNLSVSTALDYLSIWHTTHIHLAIFTSQSYSSLFSFLTGHVSLPLFWEIEHNTQRNAAAIRQVPPDWKRPIGIATPSSLQLSRHWPTKLWPRDCLEKGHYSG